jgi:RimJ/RimL family protein N-acetyltransferase
MPATSQAPVIETERAILRPHRYADFDAYAAMWSDPQVTRFIGGRPRTREESWIRFLRHAGIWSMLGYGFWALEDKETSDFVGEAGLHDLKRDMQPSIEGLPEAGWALASSFQGKGLASEIVHRVLAWADEGLEDAKTVCIIHPDHAASIRIAVKCGYKELLRTIYHGEPTILFERRARAASP